jgi:hypothetical protein
MFRFFSLFLFLISFQTAIAASDPAATHGMLLFGTDEVYLSHLPMFHRPHDYQVILKVDLPATIQKSYLEDRRKNPKEKIYTFVPTSFVLPTLKDKPFALEGSIYRGHFERGGTEILKNVKTGIPKILEFKKLDAAATLSAPEYYLVGSPGKFFMIHSIVGRPNFDHVAEVTFNGDPPEDKSKTGILKIEFVDEKADHAMEKASSSRVTAPSGATHEVADIRTLYLEKDELE